METNAMSQAIRSNTERDGEPVQLLLAPVSTVVFRTGQVLGPEVSSTFPLTELLSLPEAMLGDRHFQTVTQPILKTIQSRWDELVSGGISPCLERD